MPFEGIFRTRPLEKLRSYRQTDQLLAVVPWRSWWAVATVAFMLFLTLLWAVFGQVQVTLLLPGALVRPAAGAVLTAPATGVVERLEVQPGDDLETGSVALTVRTAAGDAVDLVVPDLAGRSQATAVIVEPGDAVAQGTVLIRTTVPGVPLRGVALVEMANRHRLEPGQDVQLEVEGLPPSQFGLLRAKVHRVGDVPLQADDLRHLFGDPVMADWLAGEDDPPKALVHLELEVDPSRSDRYLWTLQPGPGFRLDSDMQATAHVILATVPPISLLDPGRR